MPATREDVIGSVREGVEHVERTFNELSEGDLETQIEVDGREWTARDLLAALAGRDYVYDTLIRMTEFEGMPDMFETRPSNLTPPEAHVRMTRNALDEGSQSLSHRPGVVDLSDPEWEYEGAVPHAGKSTDELLGEFRRVHENLIDRLQTMPEALLDKPSPTGTGDATLADTLKARAGDFLHAHAARVDAAVSGSA